MEARMLESILRVFEQSGLKVDEVSAKHQEWGGNMRAKMDALGMDGLYNSYRLGSHAVHGTWADVLMRHLVLGASGFEVEWSLGTTDSRLLSPFARLSLEAAAAYAGKWFREDDKAVIRERVKDLTGRLEAVSGATEGRLQEEG
jgi:hypothetical protein